MIQRNKHRDESSNDPSCTCGRNNYSRDLSSKNIDFIFDSLLCHEMEYLSKKHSYYANKNLVYWFVFTVFCANICDLWSGMRWEVTKCFASLERDFALAYVFGCGSISDGTTQTNYD